MKSFFGGSAVIAATILSCAFLLSAIPSVAETPLSPAQQPRQELTQTGKLDTTTPIGRVDEKTPVVSNSATTTAVVNEATDPAGVLANNTVSNPALVVEPINYRATAYSLSGKTASGRRVSKGLIAADPSVLPLGTRVHLEAGAYSGEYLVADTGGAIRGKHIDIWTPSGREAMRFGRRTVKLTVLAYGPRRHSSRKHRTR